jgi:hypothetical protein
MRYHLDTPNENRYVKDGSELNRLLDGGEIKEGDVVFNIDEETDFKHPEGWLTSAYAYNHKIP